MSTIKANTLLHSDGSTTTQPSIPALDKRMAKAWVNFDGAAITIRDSYNVSSSTDNGTGNHTMNFNTALANANYIVSGFIKDGAAASYVRSVSSTDAATMTTGAVQVYIIAVNAASFTLFDAGHVQLAVFGN